jgi:hypothetical protein
MNRETRNPLILWLATVLSIVGFVAGFNIVIDPFGYFGTNRIGYYFSSEREFKFNLVRSYDYNVLLLGDSRMAFVDPAYIDIPGLKFVNGGIGGASIAEQVRLLRNGRLDDLKLVVFGMNHSDLSKCGGESSEGHSVWDFVRYGASWSQAVNSLKALTWRAKGQRPEYQPDGTRSAVTKAFRDARRPEKTKSYWDDVENNIPSEAPKFVLGESCRRLLREVREIADQHGFKIAVVFWPFNSDVLSRVPWTDSQRERETKRLIAEVGTEVHYVIDFLASPLGDSGNYWRHDALHLKPRPGAQLLEQAIETIYDGSGRPG